MNNSIANKESGCTGCGVCAVACPKNAIDVELNKDGFYEAIVNSELCSKCGICGKVCYKFISENEVNRENCNISKSKFFKAYSKDESIRCKSSSGGIGREIANYGIDNGYLICGVKYNYKLNRAEHIIIDKEKDLDIITGSKYIQSYTKDAFDKLDNNKKYIIFGTPSQIYGLRKYFEMKKFNNAILIDFFCHGVPSYNLWSKYLKYIKDKYDVNDICQINFREKSSGWHNYSMHISNEKKFYIKNKNRDKFLRFFLSNTCLNEPCFNCKLRFDNLYSDIRIGDFWGDFCKDDEKGTSIVIANTEKGRELIEKISPKVNLEEVSYNDVRVSQYVPFVQKPKAYNDVVKDFKGSNDLEKLYFKYLFKTDFKFFVKGLIKRIIRK